MRISDLSRQSGVPVATIKFYLREQLLPPGTPTGRNQAVYDEAHLRRLNLIRVLTSVGQLDLTSVRSLVHAIGDDKTSLTTLHRIIDEVLFPETQPLGGSENIHRARSDVDGFIEARGWRVPRDAPGRERFALVLAGLRLLGCESATEFFVPYAEAAERLARHELDEFSVDGNQEDRGSTVVRMILLDAAQTAIRRMAHDHLIATRPGQAATSQSAGLP
jgi:DNA-binding transcriptional MerR regulator